MLIDRLGLRSWVVLAVAGWALLLWLATLSGLGGRIGEVAADAGSTPALPALPVAAAALRESAADAAVVAERPLFAEDRKPHPFRATSAQGATSVLRLTGVLMAGDFAMATFSTEQNTSVRLRLNGDAVDGWQLLSLEPRRATVLGPEGAQVLELAVFNGEGGEVPTVLGNPAGTAGPAPAGAARTSAANQGRAMPAAGTAAAAASSAGTAARAPATPAADANQGPSEEQMQAIRERIRARREQLRQQQQQRPSSAPSGADANR